MVDRYNDVEDLKNSLKPIGIKGEDFYEVSPESKFTDLLKDLEERTRAIINTQIGGETLLEETDRVDEVQAPSTRRIELSYPVKEIKKVERYIRNGWETVNSELYYSTDKSVQLHSTIRNIPQSYRQDINRNIIKAFSNEPSWNQIADKVKVTYDRGYKQDNIPIEVQEIQKTLVKRLVQYMRMDQNLGLTDPSEVDESYINRELLTEDIQKRLLKVTRPKNKYTVL